MNNFNAIGRVCNDLEIKESQNNKNYLRFDLAVPGNYKNNDGKNDTDFITCIAFNKLAEIIIENVEKGDRIGITGQIKTSNYINDENNKIKSTNIILNKIDLIENKKNISGSLASSENDQLDEDYTFEDFDDVYHEMEEEFYSGRIL